MAEESVAGGGKAPGARSAIECREALVESVRSAVFHVAGASVRKVCKLDRAVSALMSGSVVAEGENRKARVAVWR
jgi:hypothetical protein